MSNPSVGGDNGHAVGPASWLKRAKPWIDAAQAIVTTLGIVIGGFWTYRLFIEGRQNHAQVVMEQKISHVTLAPYAKFVQVKLSIANTGHKLIRISKALLLIQQITPINGCPEEQPCVLDDLREALGKPDRESNRFPWPLVASRTATWNDPLLIEPGETEIEDFEFVTPGDLTASRVYAWVRNDELSDGPNEIGWHTATVYEFKSPEK
jgi:hypothetical protein